MSDDDYAKLRHDFWQLPWREREKILLGRNVRDAAIPQTMERLLLDRLRDAGQLDEVRVQIDWHAPTTTTETLTPEEPTK